MPRAHKALPSVPCAHVRQVSFSLLKGELSHRVMCLVPGMAL